MKINIDHTKCSGCKLCEVACSLNHTGAVNVQRSRIRVFIGEEFCLPVIARNYKAVCDSKGDMVMYNGHEVDECVVCRASCPVKSVFKELDGKTPLKCDFCRGDPQCVRWCPTGALTLVGGR
ncbi:hypothetical protein [Desulfobacula sp.]|uniref:hypothetical protein n=1 Tax=Desulfobacula sp. TaxID=2593537 RepID=UPI002611677A|nr:hypothetical protein [Desulfobacula sp.]